MLKKLPLAALVLFTVLTNTPRAEAQGAPAGAAAAARRQKLAAQQAAVIAAARATATAVATINRPPPVVTAPPPATVLRPVLPPPVTTASAAPKTVSSAAPKATATASAAPAASASAAPVASAAHPDTGPLALDIAALRKGRPERRHAEFVDLQSRWGNLLSDPRSGSELKLHAQRIAYLQRIRALGAKDPTFVKGVDALITKEETRDADGLNALRSGALPTSAPAVPALAAPTAPALPAAPGASK
jgi:hypothetical protein